MSILKTPHEIISSNVKVSRVYIIFNVVMSLVYLSWWFNLRNVGNPVFYGLLLIGEIYHVWQAIGYSITVWDQRKTSPKKIRKFYPVDVFVTVCGEPVEIVERTLKAATELDYPDYKVYLLNDGKARDLPGWRDLNTLAKKYGVTPITRDTNKGNKAGNVNNGLKYSSAPFFAVFDADHVPYPNFLQETMGYFSDKEVALVQTPQYYENREQNYLTTAAWEQQELFFGPICRGKGRMNATFWCGTNAVIRRKDLEEIGGVPENNIAEDFLASYFFHEKKKKTIYVSKVLAEGLAPHDLGNYVSQQFRWARGSSEIMFRYNPLFNKNLTLMQKIQYAYSSSYYLNGFISLMDAIIPVLVLFTGIVPVYDYSSSFVIYFFPFIFSTIYLLMASTENTITFRAIQLSMSSSFIFINAVLNTLFGIDSAFKVTSKSAGDGNFIKIAIPHITYISVGIISIIYALVKNGFEPFVITNASWIVFNSAMFFGFIRVAYPWRLLVQSLVLKVHYGFLTNSIHQPVVTAGVPAESVTEKS